MLKNLKDAKFPFSQHSLDILATAHPDLQRLFLELSTQMDITIVCGYRNNVEQLEAYRIGKSKVKPGCGKHNHQPALAVDAVPALAPRFWRKGKDLPEKEYRDFAYIVMLEAQALGLKIRWGGDWDGNGVYTNNQTFNDFAHYELEGD